jgi:hypothetical protein
LGIYKNRTHITRCPSMLSECPEWVAAVFASLAVLALTCFCCCATAEDLADGAAQT